ncbi:hypothetical protein Q671_00760 [Halomonas sp. PBN3]|nr:hypothetical protein Q671_00760 [Halomonas sp. PBN3]
MAKPLQGFFSLRVALLRLLTKAEEYFFTTEPFAFSDHCHDFIRGHDASVG